MPEINIVAKEFDLWQVPATRRGHRLLLLTHSEFLAMAGNKVPIFGWLTTATSAIAHLLSY